MLVAASALVAGVLLGVKDSAAHDTSAAATTSGTSGVRSHSSPAAKPSATTNGALASPTPASASASGPAAKLARLDGIGRPAEQYQQVLDALAPRCTEDRPHLAVVVSSTLADLKKNGVDDEDAFSLLQHLEQFVPAGNPRVNCASAAGTYATQREAS
ncbi:hypothetical protein [Streptomyces sp. NPDC050528]|uniref:hypothetical protein n=1 Tax=Streptomyces sp. NPDC050528 TaxID=3365623 RepID=UPI0037968415